MSKTKKTVKQPSSYRKRIIIATFLALAAIASLPWFFPYQYYRYVKCGREPVKVVEGVIGSDTPRYVLPASKYYEDYGGFKSLHKVDFYCSEQEAINAGFTNKHPDN